MNRRRFIVGGLIALPTIGIGAAVATAAGSEKVTVCHYGENELVIGEAAVEKHITEHGDTVGACGVSEPDPTPIADGEV